MKPRARIRIIKAAPRSEASLLAQIRLAVGSRADFLLTRINTGVFSRPDAPQTRVRSAPTGFPDLIGTQLRRVRANRVQETTFSRHEQEYWFYYPCAVAIETKSKRGALSDEQENWREAFEHVGGKYLLARSVEQVEEFLGEVPAWSRVRPLVERIT